MHPTKVLFYREADHEVEAVRLQIGYSFRAVQGLRTDASETESLAPDWKRRHHVAGNGGHKRPTHGTIQGKEWVDETYQSREGEDQKPQRKKHAQKVGRWWYQLKILLRGRVQRLFIYGLLPNHTRIQVVPRRPS